MVCTLGTESFRPSAAAQCVQLIAMVELPRGLWPGLIQTLVHNVTNPASTEIVKESTLQAVGYICQVTILSYRTVMPGNATQPFGNCNFICPFLSVFLQS